MWTLLLYQIKLKLSHCFICKFFNMKQMLMIAENRISSGQDSIWREEQGHHVSRVSDRLGNGGQEEENNLCEVEDA